MGLFSRQIMASDAESPSSLSKPQQWFVDWVNQGEASSAGVAVNPQSALKLSTYYACIRNISEDIAKLPLKLYRRLDPIGKEPATDHPLYSVLHNSPNPEMSSQTFREMLGAWELGWGNGTAEIIPTIGGGGFELWPIHPSRITPRRTSSGVKFYDVMNADGTTRSIPQERMFHIRGMGDEMWGWSVARVGSEVLGRALAAQRYSASYFAKGMLASGIFRIAGKFGKDARKLLGKTWPKGLPSAHDPAFFDQGMEWQPLSANPEEAQLLETQAFSVIDIVRLFRMPPHKVQDLERAHFNNVEQLDIEYVQDVLTPHSVRWEQEIQRKLIGPNEPDLFAQHVFNGLLRGDIKTRGEFYRVMFNIGAYSQDKILDLEDENPLKDGVGSHHYVPLNMQAIEDSGDDEGVPPAPQGNDQDEDNSTRAEALRGAFVETVQRLVTREVNAVGRAAKKYRVEHDSAFEDWAADFYGKHEPLVVAGLIPISGAFLSLLRPEWSGVEPEQAVNVSVSVIRGVLEGLASQWTLDARKAACEAYRGHSWRELLEDWAETRAATQAEQVMEMLTRASKQ